MNEDETLLLGHLAAYVCSKQRVGAPDIILLSNHFTGLFDDLLMKKKVANAKFLVGPIRVSRFRSGEAEKLLNTANFTGARDKLQNAALDCLTARARPLVALAHTPEYIIAFPLRSVRFVDCEI